MRFFALFWVAALAEMATFLWVGSRIGLVPALALALATALIGSLLVRRAGISVLGRIREKVSRGLLPGRELTHGAAILVSGAFLISPGFITDVVGFALLMPPVRDLIHGMVSRRLSARVDVFTAGRPRADGGESEIIDVEPLE